MTTLRLLLKGYLVFFGLIALPHAGSAQPEKPVDLDLLFNVRMHRAPHGSLTYSTLITSSVSLGLRVNIAKLPVSLEVHRLWWYIFDNSAGPAIFLGYTLTDVIKRDYVGISYQPASHERWRVGLYHTWTRDDTWTDKLRRDGTLVINTALSYDSPLYPGVAGRVGYQILKKWTAEIEYVHFYGGLMPPSWAYLSLGLTYQVR